MLFFHIGQTHELLNSWCESFDVDFRQIAYIMKEKYNKYWGDHEMINTLIYLAVLLDPNFKFLVYNLLSMGYMGK